MQSPPLKRKPNHGAENRKRQPPSPRPQSGRRRCTCRLPPSSPTPSSLPMPFAPAPPLRHCRSLPPSRRLPPPPSRPRPLPPGPNQPPRPTRPRPLVPPPLPPSRRGFPPFPSVFLAGVAVGGASVFGGLGGDGMDVLGTDGTRTQVRREREGGKGRREGG